MRFITTTCRCDKEKEIIIFVSELKPLYYVLLTHRQKKDQLRNLIYRKEIPKQLNTCAIYHIYPRKRFVQPFYIRR